MSSLRGILHGGLTMGTRPVRHLQQMSRRTACGQPRRLIVQAHKVEIEHKGKKYEFEVPEGATILDTALDNGLELPHDCKMGVCMTCPARLVEGEVDQSASMLSEDVADKGYALLCVAEPQTDCKIKTVPEEELLDVQLVTSQL